MSLEDLKDLLESNRSRLVVWEENNKRLQMKSKHYMKLEQECMEEHIRAERLEKELERCKKELEAVRYAFDAVVG